jgi:hypothetical protein
MSGERGYSLLPKKLASFNDTNIKPILPWCLDHKVDGIIEHSCQSLHLKHEQIRAVTKSRGQVIRSAKEHQ